MIVIHVIQTQICDVHHESEYNQEKYNTYTYYRCFAALCVQLVLAQFAFLQSEIVLHVAHCGHEKSRLHFVNGFELCYI